MATIIPWCVFWLAYAWKTGRILGYLFRMVKKDEESLRFWYLIIVYATGVVLGLYAAFWMPSLR